MFSAFRLLRPASRVLARRNHSTIDYTKKYADKLKKKAEEEGLSSIEELKAKYVPSRPKEKVPFAPEKLEPKVVAAAGSQTASAAASTIKNAAKPTEPTQSLHSNAASSSSESGLDKIMKLELLQDLPADEITKIWVQRHLNMDDTISAVIPGDTYKKMLERSKKYPLFLLPLKHEQGVEFYLMQFNFHQIMFTSLLEYKTHAENARPYLTLTHYPELIESKNIVLMKGSVSDNPRILSVDQAQVLVFGMQQYYVSDDAEKLKMLETFHKEPAQFDHQKLIELTNTPLS
ncbi:ATP synthase mitochondrial F1 complex assembly factor 1 [Actinomortierella ambigua]|nr:ATP synthase mitochondrial F1 complex assembly factor 1 [Actinomortierella ambigua]